MANEPLFYVLDTRTVVGNCGLWWAPEGKGYVCDLREAGKFTEEQTRHMRDTDAPVPCAVAEANIVHHVRVDTPAMEQYKRRTRSGRRA